MDPILRQGSKGSAVSELQQLLQNKGFYNGKIDGDFGAGTTNAVLKFQQANGLLADGIVGSSSWSKLRAVLPSPLQALPTLLPGSKGTAVAQAQQLLKDKGYYQGRIDGDFGMGTRDAIAAFQRANGLTVDGKVGEKTWQKLQASAIADTTPETPVMVIEIVRPSSPVTLTPSLTPLPTPPSIFIPTSTPVISTPVVSIPVVSIPVVSTSEPIPAASAISLVDAANSYSRARLTNQTAALNNLQANIDPEILQQFLQRWQIASGQPNTATSLQESLGSYNSAQMLNQNLALQWLQNQLLPQAIAQFRQDWSNLNAGIGTTTTTPFIPTQPIEAIASIPQLQLINLIEAVKVYTRSVNQVTALEKLQGDLPALTMEQFFQRWSLASEQNAIAVSLLDVFQDYDSQKFPSQVTALQWLEKELTTANLEQFSRDWQTI
jgi:peptidoglycan hydrolase-like protein with peptidoglycan-binding domain